MVDKKFIINLQGKEFITFEGLLAEFHNNGGNQIDTEIISKEPFIVKATVGGINGSFSGMGDADEDNVNRMISKHKIRMAETRAIARALRWYNNIGMCSAEELGGDKPSIAQATAPVKLGNNVCDECGAIDVSDKVKIYSESHFDGKILCFKCQKASKEENTKEEIIE